MDRGIVLNFPKELLKEAYSVNLIDNEQLWAQMLLDRNMTSHTYDEKLADEIYGRIRNYVPALKMLLERVN
jgi:nucleotidyltransferase substrate binding protein (TIGR01987 family)